MSHAQAIQDTSGLGETTCSFCFNWTRPKVT